MVPRLDALSVPLLTALTPQKTRNVHHNMPADSQAFVNEWKGKSIDGELAFHTVRLKPLAHLSKAIVEQVRDGSTLRVRLLLPEGDHQIVNIALAGVRCPKASTKQGETAETWGEEVVPRSFQPRCDVDITVKAKYFTESRLLQRPVRVQILSLPASTAIPFQSTANNAPPPASVFIGNGQLFFVGADIH